MDKIKVSSNKILICQKILEDKLNTINIDDSTAGIDIALLFQIALENVPKIIAEYLNDIWETDFNYNQHQKFHINPSVCLTSARDTIHKNIKKLCGLLRETSMPIDAIYRCYIHRKCDSSCDNHHGVPEVIYFKIRRLLYNYYVYYENEQGGSYCDERCFIENILRILKTFKPITIVKSYIDSLYLDEDENLFLRKHLLSKYEDMSDDLKNIIFSQGYNQEDDIILHLLKFNELLLNHIDQIPYAEIFNKASKLFPHTDEFSSLKENFPTYVNNKIQQLLMIVQEHITNNGINKYVVDAIEGGTDISALGLENIDTYVDEWKNQICKDGPNYNEHRMMIDEYIELMIIYNKFKLLFLDGFEELLKRFNNEYGHMWDYTNHVKHNIYVGISNMDNDNKTFHYESEVYTFDQMIEHIENMCRLITNVSTFINQMEGSIKDKKLSLYTYPYSGYLQDMKDNLKEVNLIDTVVIKFNDQYRPQFYIQYENSGNFKHFNKNGFYDNKPFKFEDLEHLDTNNNRSLYINILVSEEIRV